METPSEFCDKEISEYVDGQTVGLLQDIGFKIQLEKTHEGQSYMVVRAMLISWFQVENFLWDKYKIKIFDDGYSDKLFCMGFMFHTGTSGDLCRRRAATGESPLEARIECIKATIKYLHETKTKKEE